MEIGKERRRRREKGKKKKKKWKEESLRKVGRTDTLVFYTLSKAMHCIRQTINYVTYVTAESNKICTYSPRIE